MDPAIRYDIKNARDISAVSFASPLILSPRSSSERLGPLPILGMLVCAVKLLGAVPVASCIQSHLSMLNAKNLEDFVRDAK